MVNFSVYKTNLIYILSFLVAFLMASSLTGCNGGGSSSGGVSVVQKKVVELNVVLPASAPIALEDASVYLFGEETQVESDGSAKVSVVNGELIDISLMLPARAGDELPTVYLSSTVVPGEVDIKLDAEETALALLLDGINQKYLQNPETALFVKDLVRGESADFIAYFKTAIEADPYLLRADNIRNVLSQEYIDALTSINAILNATFEVNSSLTVTSSAEDGSVSFKANSASEAGSADSTRITIKPSWLEGNFKLGEVTDNGQYTGDLTLWNASKLPSLYKMTNTATGEVMKALPKGILNTAFSPDIFAPYACPFNIVVPNYTSVESGSKNVQIEIYTPGFQNFDSTVYAEEGNVSSALLMRSAYSYAFIPVISAVIPLKGTSAAAFDILQKAGVFDELLPYWVGGDISGGILQLYENYNGLPRAAIYSMIETAFGQVIENPDVIVAILGKKILTSQLSLATAVIALEQLKNGLLNTPSKVTFYATFPVGITDVRPLAIKKIERDQKLPEFTLNGHGFKAFEFQGTWYKPRISFQVFDNEDEPLSEDPVILENEDLRIDLTGTAITFSLPRYAVREDTKLSYVKLKFSHAYVDVGWLGMISDYFNTINEIELPVTEALQKEFTIHLSSDVYVSDVDQDWKETNETLLIRGEGFHSQKSGLINKVFFKDNSAFSPEEAVINEAWDDLISVNVPRALDLDYVSIGKTFFYVELEDGSQSNEFPLSIVPSPVTASVRGDITTPGFIYKGQMVTLKQSSSVPIFYSLNGAAEQPYVAPIELTETSSLMAYAIKEIEGTNYRSRTSRFEYKTCAKGETYIPYPHGAACVIIQNQSLIPNRYCPINSRDYSGSLYTENYEVSCIYEMNKIKVERHFITVRSETTGTKRIAIHSTTFWTQPEGRPMVVGLGQGRYYNFCPDGSFWLSGQSCSH